MRNEISSAVDFLSTMINQKGSAWLSSFKENLSDILCEHYQNHWFPEKPFKGSGYRCIRITNNQMDPLVAKAGASCGVTTRQLLAILPKELTMWVDPEEVSYRIGEDGSIGVLYDGATEIESESTKTAQLQPAVSSANTQSYVPYEAHSHTTHSQDLFQSCKDQFRNVYFPSMMTSDHMNRVPMEFFSTFVSS